MTRPARLIIMADAGGRDQRGIDQSAGSDHDASLIERARKGLEQGQVQAAAHQFSPEAHKGGAFRRGLVSRKATETTKAGAVIQRLGKLDVRKVVPSGQQEGSEQREWRPARLTLGSRPRCPRASDPPQPSRSEP